MPQIDPEVPLFALLQLKASTTALPVLGKHSLLAQRDTVDVGPVITLSEPATFTTLYAYAQSAPVTVGTCTLDVQVNAVSILSAPDFDLTSLADETLTELALTGIIELQAGDLLSILVTTSDDAITSNGIAVHIE